VKKGIMFVFQFETLLSTGKKNIVFMSKISPSDKGTVTVCEEIFGTRPCHSIEHPKKWLNPQMKYLQN
jgi:hypothetical protein